MQKENFYQQTDNPRLLNEATLPELERLTVAFPYFQAAWMLYLKNLQITGDPGFEAALKRAAVIIPDRRQLQRFLFFYPEKAAPDYYFGETAADETSAADKLEKGREDSLIDQFLSSGPAPIKMEQPPEEESDEPESPEEKGNEIVAKSGAEPDELVSETLAMIYFEQKKYDKALEAFKKLRLKYPQKSVYFATRIEEIEKLKNI